MNNISNIVIYNDGELELNVSMDSETVWLTQAQISCIFEKDQSVISRHINNIFKDKEVDKKSNMQKMHIANSDKPVNFYSLDIILAVGYRVNSVKAIKFRQWATLVLKSYILNDLLKLAKDEIILIDNYIDDSVLTLFSKFPNINTIIYTKSISPQLKLDFGKYEKQYKNVTIKTFKNSHDRFLIFDRKEIYLIGASLKDLGKKWFAFSKMNLDIKNFFEKLD